MGLINSITSWVLKKRIYQIELFIKHPLETQEEVLHDLLSTASPTKWGRKYGYSDIDSIQRFQERVPVSSYEQLYPYIEQMLHGNANVLWPGEVKWFSKSSGTTNDRSKFIPVTRESLKECHFKGGKDMGAIYLHNHPGSKLFDGKSLSVGGSHEINRFNESSFTGDLSAVLIQNLPVFFELFRTPEKKVALMGEWESKIRIMAEAILTDNITNISGVPAWTLMVIRQVLELSKGTGKALPQIWPNLEVYFHGGVNFKPYQAQFESVLGGKEVAFFETYNASEGFFGMQNESGKDDLLLMLDYGIFYEFIPLSELDSDHPKAYTLCDVEKGQVYAMVISTNGGLWRYLLGDTVIFTDLNPYKIRIAGRTRHFINMFGEELMVENAERAIMEACRIADCVVENFTAAPGCFEKTHTSGVHQWLIEFRKRPVDMTCFVETLDATLKANNSDYEAKRYKNLALREPEVTVLPEGTFYEWMKKRDKLGGQNKVPRLSNSREYLDDILAMLKHHS